MTISPFDLILLLGALQGFIVSTLLWTSSKGRLLSNRLLAVLIGLLALMSLAVGIPVANAWVSAALDFLPLIIVMPVGPIIYFYTQSVLDPSFRLGTPQRRHFYTTVVDLGSKLIGWTFLIGLLLGVFSQQDGPAWGRVMNEYDTYADIPRWLSATFYLVLTKRFLVRWATASVRSAAEQQRFRWLRQFVQVFLLFQAIWFIHLVPYIIPSLRGPLLDRLGWYPIYIPIVVLIYWLGLRGYLWSRTDVPNKTPAAEIDSGTVTRVTDALTKAIETDRLFLDPELTVDKVGQHTQLSPKLISAVLNQHLRKNFNSFINEYRVDEVKRRLLNPAYEHLTLTGIAFDCGFNSQATFQRAFKQLTGISPGEYASQQKNSSQIRI
jgi:AraC-like DNA-binding protein